VSTSFSVKLSTCLATRALPKEVTEWGAPGAPHTRQTKGATPPSNSPGQRSGRPGTAGSPLDDPIRAPALTAALERRRQCAASQDTHEVAAEIRGAALIADRPGGLHGQVRRPCDLLGRQ